MAEGIAYQNKDIEFKILSEAFKERSFEAYGLKLPKIKAVLPTNLPAEKIYRTVKQKVESETEREE